jgi:hypothetical protein
MSDHPFHVVGGSFPALLKHPPRQFKVHSDASYGKSPVNFIAQ